MRLDGDLFAGRMKSLGGFGVGAGREDVVVDVLVAVSSRLEGSFLVVGLVERVVRGIMGVYCPMFLVFGRRKPRNNVLILRRWKLVELELSCVRS